MKNLTDGGERTIWGRGLERALAKSRTQPQVEDAIGIRENKLAPVSFITRTRKRRGACRRHPSDGHAETSLGHREARRPRPARRRRAVATRPHALSTRGSNESPGVGAAYWILDAAQKYAIGRWASVSIPGSP